MRRDCLSCPSFDVNGDAFDFELLITRGLSRVDASTVYVYIFGASSFLLVDCCVTGTGLAV